RPSPKPHQVSGALTRKKELNEVPHPTRQLWLGKPAKARLAVSLCSSGNVGPQHPIPVLAEHRRVPDPVIGLRKALGARTVDIATMVMRETSQTVGVGLILGIAGALSSTRWITNSLFDLSPNDLMTSQHPLFC